MQSTARTSSISTGCRCQKACYAPSISEHSGIWYILNVCVGCGGNFIITAKNPRGPWSNPIFIRPRRPIDTSLFFDDDGTAWILYNAPPPGKPLYEGHRAIFLQRFDPATARRPAGRRC